MNSSSLHDGIFALATGEGKAAISVIRLSGSGVYALLEKLCGTNIQGRPYSFPPRKMVLRKIFHPSSQEMLDQCLVVYFDQNSSYTGEPMAELHLHGGIAVKKAVMEVLHNVQGWRIAEPGEFTKRAFLAGKLQLNEAETILDLVNAETEEQRKQAIFQLADGKKEGFNEWKDTVLMLLAHLEASLDFPEDDVPNPFQSSGRDMCENVIESMERHLKLSITGERLHQGLLVVIAGEPNVGKSSFMNRLAKREMAIVTKQAGTTRDPIELRMEWDGIPLTIVDTAGLREEPDEIEQMGMNKALVLLQQAHLVIWMKQASKRMSGKAWQRIVPTTTPMITILNKIDLIDSSKQKYDGSSLYGVSLKTGENWTYVQSEIGRMIKGLVVGGSQALITRERHRKSIQEALQALKRAMMLDDPVLIAQELREAIGKIGVITGTVTTDDILDVVFRDFCIGK